MASMGSMSTVLRKLATLLVKEYKLQKGVRGEIMFLKAELESMEAALLHIAEAPIDQQPDKETKVWAREVRNLSYDLEDSIDKFMVRIDYGKPRDGQSFKGFIDRTLDLLTKLRTRHKLGTETKAIKKRIMEISERRYRYKVDEVAAKPVGTPIESIRLLALYRTASELVGTEEKSNDLGRAQKRRATTRVSNTATAKYLSETTNKQRDSVSKASTTRVAGAAKHLQEGGKVSANTEGQHDHDGQATVKAWMRY